MTTPKSEWGEGPWQDEPDHLEWRDAATGYPCILHRVPTHGGLCGYVAVPPNHPAHGKKYDDLDVSVHGGLTYADHCQGDICHVPAPGEPDDVWWLGFDCAHAGDYSPAIQATLKKAGFEDRFGVWGDVYREVPFVQAECAALAAQLKAMEPA